MMGIKQAKLGVVNVFKVFLNLQACDRQEAITNEKLKRFINALNCFNKPKQEF